MFSFVGIMAAVAMGSGISEQGSMGVDAPEIAMAVGLSPHAVVAAGFDVEATTAMLGRIEGAETLCLELDAARQSIGQLNNAVTESMETFRLNPRDSARIQTVRQRKKDVSDAKAKYSRVRSELRAIALEGVDPTLVASVRKCMKNGHRQIADEFRVLEVTDREWIQLRRSVVAEKRALREGVAVPTRVAILLSSYRSDPAVVEARRSLQVRLERVLRLFQ